MKVLPLKIQNIHLTKANESLHSRTLLYRVDHGLKYLIHRLKDWHETMFTHINVCKKNPISNY
jgi:TFIIF-interacting CTD phosphatase-like protein